MFFDGRCSHNNYHDFILLTRIILQLLLLFKCITTTNVMGMYNIGQPFHSALYSFCISSSIKQHYSLNQKLGMM